MKRTQIESSSLASVGYDPQTQVLEVEFHGGRVYRYSAVPPDVWRSLLEADSAGRFLNREIRGVYPSQPV